MMITVGGLMIFFGIVGIVGTIMVTLVWLFAQGMSDAPQDHFSWTPSLIALTISVGLIFLGAYGGL